MSLIARIKTASIELRKAKHPLATLSTTLIGEAEMVGKNAGNREVTDSEVQALVKKFIKGINETLAVIDESGHADFLREKAWLEGWLPKQLTTDELTDKIREIIVSGARNMGEVMKTL